MAISLAKTTRSNAPLRLTCAISIAAVLIGCAQAAKTDEYRESKGQVAKFFVQQLDDYLRFVTFVKLRDGSIQDPKLYYYQGHFTPIGFRSVEKPGGLWENSTKDRHSLYLPQSANIESYLFLIRKPSTEMIEVDGKKKLKTDWSGWALLEVAAKEVSKDEPIVVPAFAELSQNDFAEAELLKKLEVMYDKAHAAAVKRMNTPVKSRSEVPWYAQ